MTPSVERIEERLRDIAAGACGCQGHPKVFDEPGDADYPEWWGFQFAVRHRFGVATDNTETFRQLAERIEASNE